MPTICCNLSIVATHGKKMYEEIVVVITRRFLCVDSPISVTKILQLATRMIYTFSRHGLAWTSCNVWLEWTSFLLVKLLASFKDAL
jgi:hypothetical protein